MTLTQNLSELLQKKIVKLNKKDRVLVIIFRKKVREIISNAPNQIKRYKNLKKPLQDLKRIHLTDRYILLFKYYPERKHVLFVDIKHRDNAYK